MYRFLKGIVNCRFAMASCLFVGILSAHGCGGEPREFTNSIGMHFVLIPMGTGEIGSPQDEPYRDFILNFGVNQKQLWEQARNVTIENVFYMESTEVTVSQFRQFRPTHTQDIPADITFDSFEMAPFCSAIANPRFKDLSMVSISENNMPVTNVSLDDALAFCQWLNLLPAEKRAGRLYRLPTEDEWEYACRAGQAGRFYWKGGEKNIGRYENVADKTGADVWNDGSYFADANDGFLTAAPVGSLKSNPFGLYDMLGNVCELTSSSYTSLEPNPDARKTMYFARHYQSDSVKRPAIVVKGGSWCSGPPLVRCAARTPIGPDSVRFDLGFRLVVEIREEP